METIDAAVGEWNFIPKCVKVGNCSGQMTNSRKRLDLFTGSVSKLPKHELLTFNSVDLIYDSRLCQCLLNDAFFISSIISFFEWLRKNTLLLILRTTE